MCIRAPRQQPLMETASGLVATVTVKRDVSGKVTESLPRPFLCFSSLFSKVQQLNIPITDFILTIIHAVLVLCDAYLQPSLHPMVDTHSPTTKPSVGNSDTLKALELPPVCPRNGQVDWITAHLCGVRWGGGHQFPVPGITEYSAVNGKSLDSYAYNVAKFLRFPYVFLLLPTLKMSKTYEMLRIQSYQIWIRRKTSTDTTKKFPRCKAASNNPSNRHIHTHCWNKHDV